MIVIAHHYPPIDSRSRPPAKQIQISDPGQPIVIIMVNGLAPVASRHHMIDGSSILQGQPPPESCFRRWGQNSQYSSPDPSPDPFSSYSDGSDGYQGIAAKPNLAFARALATKTIDLPLAFLRKSRRARRLTGAGVSKLRNRPHLIASKINYCLELM